MPQFNFSIKDIYMTLHCRAEALERQDYSKCDCTDETVCGWWAYDRQVADSAVSIAQRERALQRQRHRETHNTKTQRDFQSGVHSSLMGSQTTSMEPWGNPPRAQMLYFSCPRQEYILFCYTQLCSCVCTRRKNIKTDGAFKRGPEHTYVGVLLSHAWLASIATGCTV